jgi:hypothetical protein
VSNNSALCRRGAENIFSSDNLLPQPTATEPILPDVSNARAKGLYVISDFAISSVRIVNYQIYLLLPNQPIFEIFYSTIEYYKPMILPVMIMDIPAKIYSEKGWLLKECLNKI